MSLYLPVNARGTAAIAICPRCKFKVQHKDLVKDPNTKSYVCKNCADLYDPWRLPSRQPEIITIQHPRRDEDLA